MYAIQGSEWIEVYEEMIWTFRIVSYIMGGLLLRGVS